MYEHNRLTRCTVSDLIMGNEYYFRVYSENICGLSDSPGISKNTAFIHKTGLMDIGVLTGQSRAGAIQPAGRGWEMAHLDSLPRLGVHGV